MIKKVVVSIGSIVVGSIVALIMYQTFTPKVIKEAFSRLWEDFTYDTKSSLEDKASRTRHEMGKFGCINTDNAVLYVGNGYALEYTYSLSQGAKTNTLETQRVKTTTKLQKGTLVRYEESTPANPEANDEGQVLISIANYHGDFIGILTKGWVPTRKVDPVPGPDCSKYKEKEQPTVQTPTSSDNTDHTAVTGGGGIANIPAVANFQATVGTGVFYITPSGATTELTNEVVALAPIELITNHLKTDGGVISLPEHKMFLLQRGRYKITFSGKYDAVLHDGIKSTDACKGLFGGEALPLPTAGSKALIFRIGNERGYKRCEEEFEILFNQTPVFIAINSSGRYGVEEGVWSKENWAHTGNIGVNVRRVGDI